MYKQNSLFPGIDEEKTIDNVYSNLAIYEKSRQHIYLLEPHLQSMQLSADNSITESQILKHFNSSKEQVRIKIRKIN
ncbi:hypothetical protein [Oenococcus oeni]|uniref:hypothetical protein n=1 Tax=Oenococcus oeni TaxID=1247 RepID=UPI0010BA1484|nr:hypothetical protein [Oenococcus oeni]SYW13961.1 hypothetical protein OENI_240003 [Oenococcus oeni]